MNIISPEKKPSLLLLFTGCVFSLFRPSGSSVTDEQKIVFPVAWLVSFDQVLFVGQIKSERGRRSKEKLFPRRCKFCVRVDL